MGLFNNPATTQQAMSSRDQLIRKYESARHNILLVLGFSLVNIILLVLNANSYFLFSATVPYFFADLAMYLCGKYPMEVYGQLNGDVEFFGGEVFAVLMAVAAVILLVYLLCWFCSKNGKVGWMIFALVWFCLDTLCMFFIYGISVDAIMDIVFHAWVIISLAGGISAYNKLKKLPPEVEQNPESVAPAVETE